jgi:hypothetical protein
MKNLSFFINHIDNSISKTIIYYALIISFTLSSFFLGMTVNIKNNRGEVKIQNNDGTAYLNQESNDYQKNTLEPFDKDGNKIISSADNKSISFNKSVIFGSVKGKYFYYKGCGGDSIAAKNLRYYKTESEAIKLGKKLYNKCL